MSDKDEKEILERVAKIEQRIDDHAAADERRFREIGQINEKLDKLQIDLARYRGLVGGVLLVVTAIVSFFKMFWADITGFFR